MMMIELSKLKSKWFGESEKQVKKIFDDYRRFSNNNKIKPILFINEADGMFTKRLGISGTTSSVDHTVNTIQNIILQELENSKVFYLPPLTSQRTLTTPLREDSCSRSNLKIPCPRSVKRSGSQNFLNYRQTI